MKKQKFYKKQNTITIRADTLPPGVLQYLEKLTKIKKRNEFILGAINHYYFYTTNFKQCMTQIIELNFGLIRHLLRKIGRKNKN